MLALCLDGQTCCTKHSFSTFLGNNSRQLDDRVIFKDVPFSTVEVLSAI